MSILLWGVIGLLAIFILIFVFKKIKSNNEEDIFSRASNVSSSFKDCCTKIKNMFGGGA